MSDHPTHLVTLAHFCEVTQCPYGTLFNELRRRRIGPAFVINGVDHWDTEQVSKVHVDLLNEGRVRPVQVALHVPSKRVHIHATATGSRKGKPSQCHRH